VRHLFDACPLHRYNVLTSVRDMENFYTIFPINSLYEPYENRARQVVKFLNQAFVDYLENTTKFFQNG